MRNFAIVFRGFSMLPSPRDQGFRYGGALYFFAATPFTSFPRAATGMLASLGKIELSGA